MNHIPSGEPVTLRQLAVFFEQKKSTAAFCSLCVLIAAPLGAAGIGLFTELRGDLYSDGNRFIFFVFAGVVLALFALACLCSAGVCTSGAGEAPVQHCKHRFHFLREHPWVLLLAVLLAWSFLSALFAADRHTAFFGTPYRQDGFFTYLLYALTAYAASQVKKEVHKRRLLQVLSLASLPLCLILWGQYGKNAFMLRHFGTLLTSVYYNSNHFAYLLTICTLASAGLLVYARKQSSRIGWAACFALQALTLVWNKTLGCYIAVAAALVVLAVWGRINGRSKRAVCVLPLVLLIVVSAGVQISASVRKTGGNTTVLHDLQSVGQDVQHIVQQPQSSEKAGSGRWGLWVQTVRFIGERPLLGFGPDAALPFCGSNGQQIQNGRPHNEFLQYAAFLGVPGLALYLGALLSLFVHQVRRLKRLSPAVVMAGVCTVGYLISSFFGNTMFYTTPFFFLCLFLAADDRPAEL